MKVGYQILSDLQQQQAFKQWGYYVESQNPTDYRYWSIPFTSHYITMATKTYYEPKEEAVPWLVGIDMQKFICGYGANFIGSSYVSCVGIGCQLQWGNSWSGYTGVFNWYFPISPSQVYAACLTKHTKNISSSHNWEPARVEEWNNSYVRINPDGDLGYSVIAICRA